MSIQEVPPKTLAALFHRYRRILAPEFACASSEDCAWSKLTPNQQHCLIAAARLALSDLADPLIRRSILSEDSHFTCGGGTEGRECGC
jgi:hypothetical protein